MRPPGSGLVLTAPAAVMVKGNSAPASPFCLVLLGLGRIQFGSGNLHIGIVFQCHAHGFAQIQIDGLGAAARRSM